MLRDRELEHGSDRRFLIVSGLNVLHPTSEVP